MQAKKKAAILTACAAALAVVSAGSAVAYLTSVDFDKNVFATGRIEVVLSETDTNDADGNPLTNSYELTLVGDGAIAKDPKVTVPAGNIDSWLFVKVEGSSEPKLSDYVSYVVESGWSALEGAEGVYYRTVFAAEGDQSFSVFSGDRVLLRDGVTQQDLLALAGGRPTLNVSACAIQKVGFDDPAAAWAQLEAELS